MSGLIVRIEKNTADFGIKELLKPLKDYLFWCSHSGIPFA